MDENKVWELAQSVERTAVNQKHILKLLDRLQTRVETIEKHDGLQEERMAQMQEAIATLTESIQRVDDTSHRLRSIALEFLNHPWAGFTKFKRSFGGHDVTFAGAWDLPLQHSRYWLYRAYQMLR